MRRYFDISRRLIIVPALVTGPKERQVLSMVLDTGATSSVINHEVLKKIGAPFGESVEEVTMTTAAGVLSASKVTVNSLETLATQRENFKVIANKSSEFIEFDGLLGLDFLRGHRLTLDFREGPLSLD